LTILNAHFDPGPGSPIGSTNTDVGFYSCEVRMAGHRPAGRARSSDTNAPGARLFIYTNVVIDVPGPRPGRVTAFLSTDATVTYGPSQPGGTSVGCNVGFFTGWVAFPNPNSTLTPKSTWFPRRLGTQCTVTDTSRITAGLKVFAQDNGAFCQVDPFASSSSRSSSLTFPTSAAPTVYQFRLYVTRGDLPSGTQLSVSISWY